MMPQTRYNNNDSDNDNKHISNTQLPEKKLYERCTVIVYPVT